MKDYTEKDLVWGYKLATVNLAIYDKENAEKEVAEFALKALYRDEEHNVTDEIVKGLSFEELFYVLHSVVGVE